MQLIHVFEAYSGMPVVAVIFLVGGGGTGYLAWAFRVGKAPYRGPLRAGEVGRPMIVNLGYTMLPATVALLAATATAVFLSFDPQRTVVNKSIGAVGLAVILASGIWMFKELGRPSRSRTPEWLRREN